MAVSGEALALCPKHMEYGPCGGVELDGTCEVGEFRCVFLDLPTVRWRGGSASASAAGSSSVGEGAPASGALAMRALVATRQIVVADFPGRALERRSLRDCAQALAGRVDAALLGDAGAARVQFPPSYRAHLVQEEGLVVWSSVNCRDRNRVAIEGELAALADLGVAGVHCVTGDHPDTGHRPDAQPVFDLDSTSAAALAHRAGHLVSVAESPAVPPMHRRAERLREKVLAGAEACFVNHCGGADPVRRFIDEVHAFDAEPAFIVCVPMVVDAGSAALLRSFTTLVLPEGYLERIEGATDARAAGIDAAVALCEQLLALEGVSGVNLSGGPGSGSATAFADAMGEVAERLGLGR